MSFEGHQGYHVVRPADTKRREYLVFLRFDSFANLEKWEESEARRRWLEQLEPLTLHAPDRERHTGMEVWFTPPPGCPQPPRWKMAAATLLAIYPLIVAVQLTVTPGLAGWPLPLRVRVTAALLVCLMTYAAMPLMTRLLSRWLYGPPAR